MTELGFDVIDVVADRYAATPQLLARVRVRETSGAVVHAMALRAQVMIEPQRRPYTEDESAGFLDQFGERPRWKDTLRPFLWTFASTMVTGFTGEHTFELPIPCTYDVEVTASKYLHALQAGAVPIRLLFSGTVFTRGQVGDPTSIGIAVEQISWSLEATHDLPVSAWRELMDHFYPNAGWIRLDRESISALVRYKGERGLTTWEQVVSSLLDASPVLS
jgi:hypothetical protein